MASMPARANEIKLIVSDVDGVWTDGKIIYAGETREIKLRRSMHQCCKNGYCTPYEHDGCN